jgi:Ca2+-binding EF-hand superfamily protein
MIMGEEATEEEKLDVLAEVNEGGNGRVTYEEYEELYKR